MNKSIELKKLKEVIEGSLIRFIETVINKPEVFSDEQTLRKVVEGTSMFIVGFVHDNFIKESYPQAPSLPQFIQKQRPVQQVQNDPFEFIKRAMQATMFFPQSGFVQSETPMAYQDITNDHGFRELVEESLKPKMQENNQNSQSNKLDILISEISELKDRLNSIEEKSALQESKSFENDKSHSWDDVDMDLIKKSASFIEQNTTNLPLSNHNQLSAITKPLNIPNKRKSKKKVTAFGVSLEGYKDCDKKLPVVWRISQKGSTPEGLPTRVEKELNSFGEAICFLMYRRSANQEYATRSVVAHPSDPIKAEKHLDALQMLNSERRKTGEQEIPVQPFFGFCGCQE